MLNEGCWMLTLDNEKINLRRKEKQSKTPTYGKIGSFSPPSSSFYNHKGGDIVDNVLLTYWTMCCFLIGEGQC